MQRDYYATRAAWFNQVMTVDNKARYWDKWQEICGQLSKLLDEFKLLPKISGIHQCPVFSFMFHIPFRLQKPYLSKDERDFHLLDNPVRREKVFQKPMVAATSWKGALRATLWQLGYKEEHEVTFRLLGNSRSCDEHQAGRLYFYPTFFNKIALEVINPHNRETGIGARGPILMECVPAGTDGTFSLLYVPFGPIEQSESERRAEVAQDLEVLAEGVQVMLTTYGFGAKTSSGFGIVQDSLAGQGKLAIRADLVSMDATPTAESQDEGVQSAQLQAAIEQFLERFELDEFPHWTNEELEQSGWGRKRTSEYKRLRSRHPEWDNQTHTWQDAIAEMEPVSETSVQAPSVSEYTFRTLSELCDLAHDVANQLREGG